MMNSKAKRAGRSCANGSKTTKTIFRCRGVRNMRITSNPKSSACSSNNIKNKGTGRKPGFCIMNQETLIIWNRFKTLYPALGDVLPPTVRVDARLTANAGLCHFQARLIRISAKYLALFPVDMMQTVLPHEIAHYVDYCLHGVPRINNYHRGRWCYIMRAYGLEPLEFPDLQK